MNPYLVDILTQGSALHEAIAAYSAPALQGISDRLRRGDFDRILMSGMGSSYQAAYPAQLQLSRQPVPVMLCNTAELLYAPDGMLGARTLLWLNSQSGRSAEMVHLLDRIESRPPAATIAFSNDSSSPLATRAGLNTLIHAGVETTVSTKTYVNMLAVNVLAAVQLAGGDLGQALEEFRSAAGALESFLAGWKERAEELDRALGEFDELFLLGRGASLAAVWNGALINKEAAKCAFEGMHAAEFRHGPLELAAPGFSALIFAGSPETRGLNRDLGLEIISHGGRVLWIDSEPDASLPTLCVPRTGELSRPVVEVLPMQMLTLIMAQRKGIAAGQFRYIGKVVTRE